jgi:hypothetical protein
MSDEAIRAQRREAEASRDGTAWLKLATLLAREARYDEAGVAVLEAEELGVDGGEVLESFAPTKFEMRTLDASPPRPGAYPRLAWSRDGRTLHVAENAPDRTSGIVSWDVARGRARTVAVNLAARYLSLLVVEGDERVLLGFRDLANDGRPTVAFVKRGLLQPPLVSDHAVARAALGAGRVMTSDGTTVRAFNPPARKPVWEIGGDQAALDLIGTVATANGRRIAAFEPFGRKPRRTYRLPDNDARIHIARRRIVARSKPKTVVFAGDEVIEWRSSAASWDARATFAPSARHVALEGTEARVSIVDIRTADEARFELGSDPVGVEVAWSPSGRTLAVAKSTGELFLLEGH